MNIGFTGTRRGMTDEQLAGLARFLRSFEEDDEFHHGACIGSDEQAAMVAGNMGFKTVAHPSTLTNLTTLFVSHVILPERNPLDRNRDIVDHCDRIVATPRQTHEPESTRGEGTWYTINYARRTNKTVTIIWFDGSFVTEIARQV